MEASMATVMSATERWAGPRMVVTVADASLGKPRLWRPRLAKASRAFLLLTSRQSLTAIQWMPAHAVRLIRLASILTPLVQHVARIRHAAMNAAPAVAQHATAEAVPAMAEPVQSVHIQFATQQVKS